MYQRAQYRTRRLRLALTGPSGSGKTYSALMIAKGLGGSIAMIDSERGSGDYYCDVIDYDTTSVIPPYSPKAYIDKITYAEDAGYDILAIDSLSPAWTFMEELKLNTAESMLDEHQALAWMQVRDIWQELIDKIFQCKCHVIVTLRSKTVYRMILVDNLNRAVRIGVGPICQEGIEYHFQLMLELMTDTHEAVVMKDRLNLFHTNPFIPSEETGLLLRQWLMKKETDRKYPVKELLPKQKLSLMVAGREE
jgi:hypothetical protein